MANALYPKYKETLLQAGVNLATGTVKIALVDTGTYTYSATHQFYNSVTGVIGTPQTLASKTFTNGVFDAADVTFPAVTGVNVEALVIYVDTGTPTTSPLVAFIDVATGLPVLPNGGDITITFDGGSSKIFAL